MPNSSQTSAHPIELPELSTAQLANLCGPDNHLIRYIEKRMHCQLYGHPGNWFVHSQDEQQRVQPLFKELMHISLQRQISQRDIDRFIQQEQGEIHSKQKESIPNIVLNAGRRQVQGQTTNQKRYLQSIQDHTLTLSIGPAGCGKTYLAVAAAVVALTSHEVERIILTRPAVEAGERLGFLPGDMQQKVDPYLRPLFDALTDMLGLEKMSALMEQGRIEIAPLAYMRGRTLNDAFIILDEAQNTTRSQMKMFLTRLGFSSKMVVTGDITQIDLPNHQSSGLEHALKVLSSVEDIGICRLGKKDVVRHHLVESIVHAYENDSDLHR